MGNLSSLSIVNNPKGAIAVLGIGLIIVVGLLQNL